MSDEVVFWHNDASNQQRVLQVGQRYSRVASANRRQLPINLVEIAELNQNTERVVYRYSLSRAQPLNQYIVTPREFSRRFPHFVAEAEEQAPAPAPPAVATPPLPQVGQWRSADSATAHRRLTNTIFVESTDGAEWTVHWADGTPRRRARTTDEVTRVWPYVIEQPADAALWEGQWRTVPAEVTAHRVPSSTIRIMRVLDRTVDIQWQNTSSGHHDASIVGTDRYETRTIRDAQRVWPVIIADPTTNTQPEETTVPLPTLNPNNQSAPSWLTHPSPPEHVTNETALEVINRLLKQEAVRRNWCSEFDEFRETVNRELGFEALTAREAPRRTYVTTVRFTLPENTAGTVTAINEVVQHALEDANERQNLGARWVECTTQRGGVV